MKRFYVFTISRQRCFYFEIRWSVGGGRNPMLPAYWLIVELRTVSWIFFLRATCIHRYGSSGPVVPDPINNISHSKQPAQQKLDESNNNQNCNHRGQRYAIKTHNESHTHTHTDQVQ